MLKTCLSIILYVCLSLAARADDWEGVFQGTLGKSNIIVQLVDVIDDAEGDTRREASRYSYLPKVHDINLMLLSKTQELQFEETLLKPYQYREPADGDKKVTGHWALKIKGDKGSGTWTSPNSKTSLPIALSRVPDISVEQAGPDRNIQIATYDDLWATAVTFKDVGTAKTFGAVEVRTVKDSAFGIAFPVLGNFPDGQRRDKLNKRLLADHLRAVVEYRECKNAVPLGWEAEDAEPQISFEVAYATPRYLSFSESGSLDCGGAHPSNYVKPHSYDLLDATAMGGVYQLDLSPNGFGRILKLANKQERIAFERFALGRWKEAAAKDTEMAGECNMGWIDDAPEGEKVFYLSFEATGLAVTRVDYPHVASVCMFTDFNPTIIPWADLKPWLRPDQKLLTTEIQK